MPDRQAGERAFPRPGALSIPLAGSWRWLPWFPLAVMAVVTAGVAWLARDAQAWWLLPVVISPALLLALVMAHDLMGMRLWVDAQGVTYRGLGYSVDAPWERIAPARDRYGDTLLFTDPSSRMAGWFGFLFALARGFAPAHGRRASHVMRSVPLYCFDQHAVATVLRQYAPAGRFD